MNIPMVYGECRCCGKLIYSGDTFASVWKDGEVVGLECEECMDRGDEK